MKTLKELNNEINEIQRTYEKEFCLVINFNSKQAQRHDELIAEQNILLEERKERFDILYSERLPDDYDIFDLGIDRGIITPDACGVYSDRSGYDAERKERYSF